MSEYVVRIIRCRGEDVCRHRWEVWVDQDPPAEVTRLNFPAHWGYATTRVGATWAARRCVRELHRPNRTYEVVHQERIAP